MKFKVMCPDMDKRNQHRSVRRLAVSTTITQVPKHGGGGGGGTLEPRNFCCGAPKFLLWSPEPDDFQSLEP